MHTCNVQASRERYGLTRVCVAVGCSGAKMFMFMFMYYDTGLVPRRVVGVYLRLSRGVHHPGHML